MASSESKLPFRKVLIANRGEIALRIIKTCRRLNLQTVAIHTEIDRHCPFVAEADEHICLESTSGPASTYLNIERLVQLCQQLQVDAVHPGYGFLSENERFSIALEEAGIRFIGPNSNAIRAMGDKIESKRLAVSCGVNVIEGIVQEIDDLDRCITQATELGFPVMIKASAGGGGKGMRVCRSKEEIRSCFEMIRQEAQNAFGDKRIFMERYIENARHIEIQIICDHHGNAFHLLERECSIQRRNQKVIEECPSPFMDEKLRSQMCDQALKMAQKVQYDSVGTVEFLVDTQRRFYFLEMNTRLQVEHPVTEMVTGLDLVEQMFRIAAGQRISFTQRDIEPQGWALECRVYAEDPLKNFGLPSTGRLKRYIEPHQVGLKQLCNERIYNNDQDYQTLCDNHSEFLKNLRIDSGVKEGSAISIHYDPLMSKVITHGKDRKEAIVRMRTALDMLIIRGVNNNISLLSSILNEPNFASGLIHTNFLSTTFGDQFKPKPLQSLNLYKACSLVASIYEQKQLRNAASNSICNLLTSETKPRNLFVTYDQQTYELEIQTQDNYFCVHFNSTNIRIQILKSQVNLAAPLLAICFKYSDKENVDYHYSKHEQFDFHFQADLIQLLDSDAVGNVRLQFHGCVHSFHICNLFTHEMLKHMREIPNNEHIKCIRSPMPGVIRNLSCKPNDQVLEGQEVCVVEAMKMQNSLSFPVDGVIKIIHCRLDEAVEEGQLLLEIY